MGAQLGIELQVIFQFVFLRDLAGAEVGAIHRLRRKSLHRQDWHEDYIGNDGAWWADQKRILKL